MILIEQLFYFLNLFDVQSLIELIPLSLFSALFSFLEFGSSQAIHSFKISSYEGGVGHMVAAALQTKGVIDQSIILSNFEDLKMIASLFYLFSIGMAIGAVAVFGSYQQGLYLLIGPVFFYFATSVTTETDGITLRLGDYRAPNSIQSNNEFLNYIRATNDDGGERKVGLIYATVDGIATEVIQKVIEVFLDASNRDHLRFVAREHALAYLMMGISESTAFGRLISESFMGECSEVFTRAVQYGGGHIANPLVRERDQADLTRIQAEMKNLMSQKTVELNRDIKSYLRAFKGRQGFENVPDMPIEDQWMVNCGSVWGWIEASSKVLADERLNPEAFEGLTKDQSDTPWEKVYPDVIELISQGGDRNKAVSNLSAYIFKNTLHFSTHAALQSQVFPSGSFNAKESEHFLSSIAEAERHGGFMMIKYLAGSIPYIQGLLLYLLSIAYPFFAILLVMPGKATSFLVWCSLWVWVKSWDLGYALVFVIRDMLWNMLKYKVNGFDQNVDWSDPGSIFALILNNDPLASQNTYWEIIAFLTISVPLLTAQFCLGATSMLNMFDLGINQTAARFRGFETGRGKRFIANKLESKMADDINKLANEAARAALNLETANPDNNPYGSQNMFGEALGKDNFNSILDIGNNRALFGGASANRALSARQVGEGLGNIGTPANLSRLQNSLANVYALEESANKNVPSSARPMDLPKAFKGADSLNRQISSEEAVKLRKEIGKIDGLKENKDLNNPEGKTWGKYLEEYANAKNEGKDDKDKERLVVPHLLKGMQDLDSAVSQESLDRLYQKGDPLNNGGETTWRQVFERSTSDREYDHAALAAIVGRKYNPPAASGGGLLFDAAKSQAIASYQFGGLTDSANSNYLPGGNSAINGLTSFFGSYFGSAIDSLFNNQRESVDGN